jgi:hypothetical protein
MLYINDAITMYVLLYLPSHVIYAYMQAAQAKLQDAQLNTHTAATTITSVTVPMVRSVLADGCTIEECGFQASVCLYKLKRHAEVADGYYVTVILYVTS